MLLGILAGLLLLYLVIRRIRRTHPVDKPTLFNSLDTWGEAPGGCAGCKTGGGCGQHTACKSRIQYFEDEELDRFAQRSADSYTSEEEQEFAEVWDTLAEEERPAWLESLTQRQIHPPQFISDTTDLPKGR